MADRGPPSEGAQDEARTGCASASAKGGDAFRHRLTTRTVTQETRGMRTEDRREFVGVFG